MDVGYHSDFKTFIKRYIHITQWQSKEIQTMVKFIHAVLAATLSFKTPNSSSTIAPCSAAYKKLFFEVYASTNSLVEFTLITQYPSYDGGFAESDNHWESWE